MYKNIKIQLNFIIYKFILLFYPKYDLQLRFLPIDKIRRVIVVKQSNIKYFLDWGDNIPKSLMIVKHSDKKDFYLNGDWDLKKTPFERHYIKRNRIINSVYQIIVDNVPYQETKHYVKLKKDIMDDTRNKIYKNLRSIEEINRYFENIYKTYDRIKSSGYKSQRELGRNKSSDEIRVVIDREGNVIKMLGGGDHRFIIAKKLDIDKLPVYIDSVHIKWIQKCYEIYGGDVLYAINKGLDSLRVK